MKPKYLLLITTLLSISLLISACSSTIYASTGWSGLTVDTNSNIAYLASGTQVYGVDLNTGAEKWHYPDKANSKINFYADPVITPDGKQLLVPSYDHNLYSIDTASGSGSVLFGGSTNRLIASPLIINNVIYQPSTDGKVYAIDLTTHNKVWGNPATTGGPIWAAPTTVENCSCLYVASMDHKVYKFDAATGKELDVSNDLGGSIIGTPAIGPDGTMYVGTFGKEMIALDSTNLKSLKWSKPFSTHDWVWSGPALVNNVLYFGDLSGYFYVLNAADGSTVFSPLQVSKPIVSKPLVSGDKIYFTAESDTLYIIDKNGNITSKVVGGTIYSSPVDAGNSILVAPTGYSAQLVALSPDGTQKWVFPPPK